MRQGDTFHNFDSTRSFKNFSGRYNCNYDHVVYLLQCESCSKKYVGSTKTKFGQMFNVYKSYFRTYARKHTPSIKGNRFHKQVFSVTFLKMDTKWIFGLGLKS